MADDAKSRIAELEKELYAKDFKPEHDDQFISPSTNTPVPRAWGQGEEAELLARDIREAEAHHEAVKKMTKKILVASIAFFVLAASFAGYMWWRGTNIISGENISIDVLAPLSVTGGEPFESRFSVKNDNTAVIEEATLYVEYQAGFYDPETKEPIPRTKADLGTILPGQVATHNIPTVLYGEENSERTAEVILEYRMAGSNATLKKTTDYAVKISSSPITLKLTTLKEASAGQEIELAMTVSSNSKDQMDNLLVSADYPPGFTFKSADPAPSFGNNLWALDALSPQASRTIKVRGIVSGQEGGEGVAKLSVGTASPKDPRIIGVVYNSITESILITKPSFAVDLAINGMQGTENIVSVGKGVRVDVVWQNNNPTKITDAVIEVSLKGELLNRYSIYANGGGFYRSTDDTIVWEKTGTPELANVDAGERGNMSFSFSPITQGVDSTRLLKNPQITIEVKAHARRTSEGGGSDEVTTFVTRKIKIETALALSVRGLYFSGPFKNTGPMPPRAEQATTYTIVWTVRNSSNNVSNVSVKSSLPIYVKWLGAVYPQDEDIVYRTGGSDIVWNAGTIPAGGTKEVAFQISLLPSISQINQFPNLTGETTMTGTDDFTKTELSDKKPAVRTLLTGDPQFVQSQGAVVK